MELLSRSGIACIAIAIQSRNGMRLLGRKPGEGEAVPGKTRISSPSPLVPAALQAICEYLQAPDFIG